MVSGPFLVQLIEYVQPEVHKIPGQLGRGDKIKHKFSMFLGRHIRKLDYTV